MQRRTYVCVIIDTCERSIRDAWNENYKWKIDMRRRRPVNTTCMMYGPIMGCECVGNGTERPIPDNGLFHPWSSPSNSPAHKLVRPGESWAGNPSPGGRTQHSRARPGWTLCMQQCRHGHRVSCLLIGASITSSSVLPLPTRKLFFQRLQRPESWTIAHASSGYIYIFLI